MAERRAQHDPPRRLAYDLLRSVDERGAFANLALPTLLRERRLPDRDAALATELAYGTLRAQGTLDAIIASAAARPAESLDASVLDVLRLGAYQLLRTRIPSHAAVSATVELARATGNARASGLVNAVLRKIDRRDWHEWTDDLTQGEEPVARVAARHAHPRWIAEAFVDALGVAGDDAELERALAADDTRPKTHLVARPGAISRAELLAAAGPAAEPGPYSPYAVRLDGGDPGALAAVRDGRAGVQDEGSQLCAIAFTQAELTGRDERWLDLCAGPGGKAALIAAIAQDRGARLSANELHVHRAELVRQAVARWPVDISVGDATELPAVDGGYDRILIDAPCTGLGALRRRPEARWRRSPDDLPQLTELQLRLVRTAARLVRPGGSIVYVTCSPHPAETVDVVRRALDGSALDGSALDGSALDGSALDGSALDGSALEQLDARAYFDGVPDLGDGPAVQLWPHRHGTDAMFCAVLRRADR